MSIRKLRAIAYPAGPFRKSLVAASHALLACSLLGVLLARRIRDAGRELSRAEARLRRMEDRLRRTRGREPSARLAGRVAHDFNNLLTAINAYAELASSRLPQGHPAMGMLEEIRKAGERASAITGRLPEIGRGKAEASGTPARAAGRPIPGDPVRDAAGPGRSAGPSGSARRTVLVVDDDENVRSLAATALRGAGCQVLEASGAREAMFLHEQHPGPIHVLLTDVIMPGRSGRELALDLQRLRTGIRTIFMSGYTGDILLEQGLETSRALLLGKPFTSAQLAAKLSEAEALAANP